MKLGKQLSIAAAHALRLHWQRALRHALLQWSTGNAHQAAMHRQCDGNGSTQHRVNNYTSMPEGDQLGDK